MLRKRVTLSKEGESNLDKGGETTVRDEMGLALVIQVLASKSVMYLC